VTAAELKSLLDAVSPRAIVAVETGLARFDPLVYFEYKEEPNGRCVLVLKMHDG